jgi:hypothetical protein
VSRWKKKIGLRAGEAAVERGDHQAGRSQVGMTGCRHDLLPWNAQKRECLPLEACLDRRVEAVDGDARPLAEIKPGQGLDEPMVVVVIRSGGQHRQRVRRVPGPRQMRDVQGIGGNSGVKSEARDVCHHVVTHNHDAGIV